MKPAVESWETKRSDTVCIQNSLKNGDASILPLFNFVLE